MIEKIDILKVVERYVKLKRRGSQYVGLCPFHKEKTPSFYVDPEKGVYHCFGCGSSGNAITFLSEIEGITKREAFLTLAEEFGLDIRAADHYDQKNYPLIHELLNEASRFYKLQLLKHRYVVDYLKGRGLNMESIAEWELGFSPDKYELIRFLINKGFTTENLILSGLGVNTSREIYDRFHHRVIFPIKDLTGRIVSFAGRSLDEKGPKYLNGPESPIFKKSEVLYGLHVAKKHARELGYFYLVEGYMDVILMHQKGYKNTVGVMGTALTEKQGEKMYRFAKKVVIIPDGDESGIKAAENHIFSLVGVGMDPYVIVLPEGEDPASYIIKNDRLPEDVQGFRFILKDRPNDPQLFAERLSKAKKFISILRKKDENLADYYLAELRSWAGTDITLKGENESIIPSKPNTSLPNLDKILILGYAYGFNDLILDILANMDSKTSLQHRIEHFIKSGVSFAEFFETLKPEEAGLIQSMNVSKEEVFDILKRLLFEFEMDGKRRSVNKDIKALLEFYNLKKEVCS